MDDFSAEESSFADIREDSQDRMPQKKTAGQILCLFVGLTIMAVGGLLVAAGAVIRASRGTLGLGLLPLGTGCCALGYACYQKSQRRIRQQRKSDRND